MSDLLDITELNDMVSQSVQDTFQNFNQDTYLQQTKDDYDCDCLQQQQQQSMSQTQQQQGEQQQLGGKQQKQYAGIEVTQQFMQNQMQKQM